MPGKAKRKGKHPHSKKSKAILRHGVAAPPEMTAGKEPAAPATAPASAPAMAQSVVRPAPPPKATAATATGTTQYPHFIPELKRIGLLAAIILVVLVVLSVVLS